MQQQIPGVDVIHMHEGRITGSFDLPVADMQHVRYQGRVVLVLVADADEVKVKDTKDGDTKAFWTFKGVDAALVRVPSMVEHLANALFLEGTEELYPKTQRAPLPPGVTSETFVIEDEEDGTIELDDAGRVRLGEDNDEELSTELIGAEVPQPRRNIFAPAVRQEREAKAKPIQHEDKLLESWLNDDRVTSDV